MQLRIVELSHIFHVVCCVLFGIVVVSKYFFLSFLLAFPLWNVQTVIIGLVSAV